MNESMVKLGVFYRGAREYIQGSLIVFLAGEHLRRNDPGSSVTIRRVRFKRILNANLLASFSPCQDKESGIGDIAFNVGGRRTLVYLCEDRASGVPKRIEDEPSRILHYARSGHLRYSGRFSPVKTFDDILCSVVEMTKRCVAESFPGARDIWFVGLQDSDIVYDERVIGNGGELRVNSGMETWHGDRVITSCKSELEFDNKIRFNADVIFSCVAHEKDRQR